MCKSQAAAYLVWSVLTFAGTRIFDCSQYLIDTGLNDSVAIMKLPPLNLSNNKAISPNWVHVHMNYLASLEYMITRWTEKIFKSHYRMQVVSSFWRNEAGRPSQDKVQSQKCGAKIRRIYTDRTMQVAIKFLDAFMVSSM